MMVRKRSTTSVPNSRKRPRRTTSNAKTSPALTRDSAGLFDRVAILERAHASVVRSVNSQMVLAYWHIGREIVQVLQGGDDRAEYGRRMLEELSSRLTERYGRGFSATNLRYCRIFYQAYEDRVPEIRHIACDESGGGQIRHIHGDVLDDLSAAVERTHAVRGFSDRLGWSHYRALMKVTSPPERLFYERA